MQDAPFSCVNYRSQLIVQEINVVLDLKNSMCHKKEVHMTDKVTLFGSATESSSPTLLMKLDCAKDNCAFFFLGEISLAVPLGGPIMLCICINQRGSGCFWWMSMFAVSHQHAWTNRTMVGLLCCCVVVSSMLVYA